MSDKPTARPWRVANTRTDDNTLAIPIVDDYGCIAWMVNRQSPETFGSDVANAAHIVKCVNAFDEMLMALRRIAENNGMYTRDTLEDIAAEALAKAEGRGE